MTLWYCASENESEHKLIIWSDATKSHRSERDFYFRSDGNIVPKAFETDHNGAVQLFHR